MAPARDVEHPHVGDGPLSAPRLVVGGDLRIAGPGTTVHVRGDGGVARVTVAGRIARARGDAAAVLRRLADGGVILEVADPRGRLLARAGAVRPSLAGRLLAGSAAVRPTARGLVAGLRGSTRKENP